MSERIDRIDRILQSTGLGLLAVAGACFAFAAGGHSVAAEQATSIEAQLEAEERRNSFLIPAALFEAAAIGGIILQSRRPRS